MSNSAGKRKQSSGIILNHWKHLRTEQGQQTTSATIKRKAGADQSQRTCRYNLTIIIFKCIMLNFKKFKHQQNKFD